MNDKQRAKLSMLQATLGVLTDHADLYTPNKSLTNARIQLAEFVAALDPTAPTQQGAATPEKPAAVKQTTRLLLAQRAAEVAAALLAYADETDNVSLLTDADYSEKALGRATDNDLPRIAKNIHDQAKNHFAALQEQGVTQQELTELAAALTTFQQEKATPRIIVATGKALKQQIDVDIRQANALLRNRIDKFLIRYQRPQPQFYTAYQSARQVINTAARSEKPDIKPAPVS